MAQSLSRESLLATSRVTLRRSVSSDAGYIVAVSGLDDILYLLKIIASGQPNVFGHSNNLPCRPSICKARRRHLEETSRKHTHLNLAYKRSSTPQILDGLRTLHDRLRSMLGSDGWPRVSWRTGLGFQLVQLKDHEVAVLDPEQPLVLKALEHLVHGLARSADKHGEL